MAGLIPQDFIDDLIARADIVDVVGRRVQLKKAGREFKACCPFHDEKTPSFTVSPAKGFYHCFGCGAHGTAIGFLMEYDHMSFVEAIAAKRDGDGISREQVAQLRDVFPQLEERGAGLLVIGNGLPAQALELKDSLQFPGTIWVGTFGGGLNHLDRATGNYRHFRKDEGDSGSIPSDRVMALVDAYQELRAAYPGDPELALLEDIQMYTAGLSSHCPDFAAVDATATTIGAGNVGAGL